MVRMADVEGTDLNMLICEFFTWGPRIPNGLQGIKETLHTVSNLGVPEGSPSDPYERVYITMYSVYPSWSYLKGLITFLGSSPIGISILFVASVFYISPYMGHI